MLAKKLTDTQKIYTVTEKELLNIFESLKSFRTIPLGPILRIYTDHKNLRFINFNTDRVLRWRLILEEYGPYIEYIQGGKYIVSDVLSTFTIKRNQETTQDSTYKI